MDITGQRLTLRELTEADAGALHEILSDPRVDRHMLDEAPPTLEQVRGAIAGWRAAAAGQPRGLYKLAATLDCRLVGLGTLTVTDVAHRRGEIGYLIHPDRWGQGLATETATLLLEIGFRTAGLHRIEATTRPDHPASYRVMEKIGMRAEGRMRDHFLIRGVWRDSLRYAIVAGDRDTGAH